MADDQTNEAAKKRLAEERHLTEKSRAEYAEHSKGKPTPTQEENDMAALGAHITEHEDDGSGPDPNVSKQAEAGRPGAPYQTRQSTAQQGGQHQDRAAQHRTRTE